MTRVGLQRHSKKKIYIYIILYYIILYYIILYYVLVTPLTGHRFSVYR